MGFIYRAYPTCCTVQCVHKNGDGRSPFKVVIRGYQIAKTAWMDIVETFRRIGDQDGARDNPLVCNKAYGFIVIVKHGKLSHKRNDLLFRRFFLLHVIEQGISLRNNGRMSFSDTVTFLDRKHSTHVSGITLRRSLDWIFGELYPRNQKSQVLLERIILCQRRNMD